MRTTKFKLNATVFTLILALEACSPQKHDISTPPTNTPQSIHDDTLVLDSHIDLELDLIAEDMDPWASGKSRVDLAKMKFGGMDGAFLIVFSPQGDDTKDAIAKAARIAETRYQAIHRLIKKHSGEIELALSADDARRIHETGKRIAFIGVENAFPLGHSVDGVDMWAKRGVRYMGITHVGHNQFGDSSNPSYSKGEKQNRHGGLSPLGKDLIAAMNKAGVMVDVSHAGKETMMQAVALSKVPVIASHSAARGVADNVRNLDDEQLYALAKTGGVIQIVAYGPYLKNLTPEQEAFKVKVREEMGLLDDMAFLSMDSTTEDAYDNKMKAAHKLSPAANISDLVDHIDYVVKTVGIDYVGISSDFDGGGKIEGWMDASETMNVTNELVKRGYSQEDIKKIWSGNILRVLEQTQTYAQE